MDQTNNDPINPNHYKGLFALRNVETIDVSRHLDFDLGNYYKYLARLYKKDDPVQDFNKAKWYANDWIDHHHAKTKEGLLINPCWEGAYAVFSLLCWPEPYTELYDRFLLMRVAVSPQISPVGWHNLLDNYEAEYLKKVAHK